MMDVLEIRGRKSFAGPGVYGYDAEAKVIDGGMEVYVGINYYDDMRHYTVSKESVYDGMTGELAGDDGEEMFAGDPNFLEKLDRYVEKHPVKWPERVAEYTSAKDAMGSKYGKVYDTLWKMISRMMEGA